MSNFLKILESGSNYNRLKMSRMKLHSHPIYSYVKTSEHMKIFMESHCFAVYDFMILLKSLQNKLICTNILWQPPVYSKSARFINSIILGEETDEIELSNMQKISISHYELYLKSMKDIGANTSVVESYVKNISLGKNPHHELENIKIPKHVKTFVTNTLNTVESQCFLKIASSFYFGREDPIPQMFKKFLNNVPHNDDFEYLKHYLKRHIDVDENEHGPQSLAMLEELVKSSNNFTSFGNFKDSNCIDTTYAIDKVIEYGADAIDHRIKFWDGILCQMKNDNK